MLHYSEGEENVTKPEKKKEKNFTGNTLLYTSTPDNRQAMVWSAHSRSQKMNHQWIHDVLTFLVAFK